MQVEDPEPPEIVVGLQFTLSPVGEEVEAERLTEPVKPFTGDTVATNEPEDPEAKLTVDGLAVRLKSGDDDTGLKNSAMAFALASFDVRVARFQLTSTVFVSEY